ncbi:hypothetical protein [cf. Phormidesmis sp. LEGE 11477]|uniref:hypothetical protein n=1 Tax=cf. Phormidesmis sp. LEGE 11477 TaxID=1828680 RepID=UPI00187F4DDB|nr:hypothetical protein [cf. Phormidesmis sp. LEGE 11477]MBE9064050.1 hypothetical protein [cf. Phormidesmis sp. LEGE 11477]
MLRVTENIVLIVIAALATVALVDMLYQAGYEYGVVEGFRAGMRERAIESEATEL